MFTSVDDGDDDDFDKSFSSEIYTSNHALSIEDSIVFDRYTDFDGGKNLSSII